MTNNANVILLLTHERERKTHSVTTTFPKKKLSSFFPVVMLLKPFQEQK